MTNTTQRDDVRALLVSAVENTSTYSKRTGRGGRKFTMAGVIALTITGALAGGALSAAAFTLATPAAEPPQIPPGQFQEVTVSYIKAFDRPAQPTDQLPADLPDYALGNLKPDTARLIGEHEGLLIYLAEGAVPLSPVCAVVWAGSQNWVVGCGGVPMGVHGRDLPVVKVTPPGEPLGTGETRLDENVIITD